MAQSGLPVITNYTKIPPAEVARGIKMANYSPDEFLYARPVAQALLTDGVFRQWFLAETKFADRAYSALPLIDEPKTKRTTPAARKWFWFNCFCGAACECKVETGIETDILIIFRASDRSQFALHVEVKCPGKGLGGGQAESYPRRGRCWANYGADRPAAVPKWIPHHDDFATILLCDDCLKLDPRHVLFDDVILHRDLEQRISPYPDLVDMRQG